MLFGNLDRIVTSYEEVNWISNGRPYANAIWLAALQQDSSVISETQILGSKD